MTTTVAPSPAGASPTTSASPAAVARAAPARAPVVADDGDGGADPRDAARSALAERRNGRLRLVQPDDDAGDDVVDAIVPEGDETPTADVDPNADAEEQEPEQTPSWAQKLKTENEQAKAKIAEHEQREQAWTSEVARIKAHHEDISADVAHYKALYDSCADFLSKLINPKTGRPYLDPREVQLAEHRRQLGIRDRQIARGGQAQSEDGTKKAATAMSQRFDAYRQKHPEMDWTKNAEAKAFVAELLASPLPQNLDRIVEMFVAEQRWKRAQKKPTGNLPVQRPRPDTTSTAGAPSGGTPRRATPRDDGYDRDQIKAEVAQSRAARMR